MHRLDTNGRKLYLPEPEAGGLGTTDGPNGVEEKFLPSDVRSPDGDS
jgi:hypothetical protein